MAQPTAFNKANEYAEYASDNPDAPLDHSALDEDFDAVETTLDAICENLEEIQRDDGALKNASVHPDSLSTATLALIAADWTPLGLWVTATEYVVGDVVENSTTSYVCAEAHTAGTFATDHADGKWIVLGSTFIAAASSITFTAAGNLASTDVQAAIEELDDEKAALNGSGSEVFAVGDATSHTHAAAAGQIQKSSLISALAAGTSDALTATIASGLTALTDRMHVRIEAASANATTAPTLNLTLGSTATGVKTIKKGSSNALAVGDIDGAGHMLELVYDLTNDCWLLQNPAFPVGTSSQSVAPDSVNNVGLSFAVGSSALTATLTTATGGTPLSSDPVEAAMRSATASTGTFATREATSGLTLVVPSTATLGHSDDVEAVTHWYLIDNGGTLELAVSSKFFGYSGIVSTTAISTSADSATVMYSTSARSTVAFAWIAKTLDTQTTAGTWAVAPSRVELVRETGTGAHPDGCVAMSRRAADGDVEWVSDFRRRNLLINGDFKIAQRGTSFTAATVPLNSDDTYLLDRWALLSDGNDVVDVTQETSVVPTGGYAAIKLDVETANLKFGVIQFIEKRNCHRVLGGTVSLSFRARKGASNATVDHLRAAVIAWDSTADTVTSDVVSAWGAEGADPTLVANWTYENTPSDLTLTDAYQTFKIENISVDTASAANVAVFIWCDNSDPTVADLVYITDVQLEPGTVATEFQQLDFTHELALCERYYEKSYNHNVAPGTATDIGLVGGFPNSTGEANYSYVALRVRKRANPTISHWDGAGTASQLSLSDAGANTSWTESAEAASAAPFNAGELGFYFGTDGLGVGARMLHYAADAEM